MKLAQCSRYLAINVDTAFITGHQAIVSMRLWDELLEAIAHCPVAKIIAIIRPRTTPTKDNPYPNVIHPDITHSDNVNNIRYSKATV